MLDRSFLKSYLAWLDSASPEELGARHADAMTMLEQLRDPDVRRDARYLLRLLEAEIPPCQNSCRLPWREFINSGV